MDEHKDLIKDCIGAVEANEFETMCLWEKFNARTDGVWESATGGSLAVVGWIEEMPVCISLLVHTINGHPILFYHATSQLVDYEMVNKWLDENMPDIAKNKNGRLNKTDAMNFNNVFPRGDYKHAV